MRGISASRGVPDQFVVLYISYDGVLEPIGQSQVLPYLERLALQGVKIALLTFEKAGDLKGETMTEKTRRRLEAAGILWTPRRYHKRPPILATLFDVFLGMVSGLRLSRRHDVRLVHVRSYVPAVMALPLRWLMGRPILFDIRGFWVDERVEGGIWQRGLVYLLVRQVERFLYRSADGVVSLTEAGRQAIEALPEIARRGVPVSVVPTCVAPERFAGPPDPALADTIGRRHRTVLAYVGSIGTWYATEELLDFFQVVGEVIPGAGFLLIVREATEGLSQAVERRGLAPVTTVVASVPYGEVPRWLSVSRAGVAFYRPGRANLARCPTKIGEYLASGLPVVISAGVGDCDRILEDERIGVLVREFSAPEYRRVAKTLQVLLEDETLSARCRRVARERLSVEEGVRAYHSIYCGLAGRRALKA